MTTRLRILHRTRYAYGAPAAFSQHLLRLTPRERADQHVISHDIVIAPAPESLDRIEDAFGNRLVAATVSEPHETLEIVAHTVVERRPDPDLMAGASTPWEEVVAAAAAPGGLAAAPFAQPSAFTAADDALEGWTRASFPPGRPALDGARELCSRLHEEFAYLPGSTGAETTALQSFRIREGVCQDFAHVMIAGLRALGLPAAYVSGYLRTRPPPGRPRLVGADASHAWVEVWDPRLGWTGLDPTNDVEPADEHVVLAVGRDYADCAPVTGLVVGSGDQILSVSVDVTGADEPEPPDEG